MKNFLRLSAMRLRITSLLLYVGLLIPLCSFGQGVSIVGTFTVNYNQTYTYSTSPNNFVGYAWDISGGTVVGGSSSSSSVSIKWTTSGLLRIRATRADYSVAVKEETITVIGGAPPKPPTPTVTRNCFGNATLQRATPPSGVSYFWQTSSTGTQTASPYNQSTYTINSTRTVYLRARNNSTNLWSSAASRYVSVSNDTPADAKADRNFCVSDGSLSLSSIGTPSGGTWKIVSPYTETITSFNPSARGVGTYTLVYEVQASGCSDSDVAIFRVNANPSLSVSDRTISAGQTATLSINSPNGAYTYSFWNNSETTRYANNVTSWTTPRLENTTYYKVRATQGSCVTKDQVKVTVNNPPKPVVSSISKRDFCVGGNEKASITISSFNDAVYDYYMYRTDAQGSPWPITQNPYQLSQPSPGGGSGPDWSFSYRIYAKYGGRTSAHSNTFTITIHDVKNDISGTVISSPTCENGPVVNLSGSPSGGVWKLNGNTVTQFRPSNATPGANNSLTYTVTVNKGSYSCQSTYGQTIFVTDVPTIDGGSDVSVCKNSGNIDLDVGAKLNGSAVSNGQLSWSFISGPQTLNPGAGGVIGTNVAAGTYTFSCTYSGNGCSASDAKRVIIKEKPALSISAAAVRAGKSARINVTNYDARYTYQYKSSDGTVLQTGGSSYNTPALENNTTYKVRATLNGCYTENSVAVTVNAPPSPTLTMADPHYCLGVDETNDIVVSNYDATYTYYLYDVSSPATKWLMPNGVYSKSTPTVGGETTFNYKAEAVYNSRTSSASNTISFTVHLVDDEVTAPSFTFSSCEDDGSVKVLPAGSPSGGVWSGTGVTYESGQYRFNTNIAGVGTHTLTYTATASYGCEGRHTQNVTVRPGNTVAGDLNPPSICKNSGNINLNSGVTLDGSQVSNGTLSWTQVSGSQSVTPSADGSVTTNLTPDTYIFQGTYTAPNGCEATNVKRVIIKARPALSVDNETIYAGKTATLRINSPNAQYAYSFWNAAGTVEYANNVTSWTTPALENNTNYLVKAVYNGCTSSKTVTVTVNAPPAPTLTMADPHYCLGVDETNDIVVSNYDATYTYYLYDVSSPATKWLMPNGVYSKSTPTVGGETTFNYKAEAVYNSRTSSASNTISFTVHLVDDEVTAPSFTFSSCEDDGSVKVLPAGSPSGGVWSGTGVTYESGQYRFNTNIAGVGTHTLTYTATASYGCEGRHTQNVTVRPGNTVAGDLNPPAICKNSGNINLNSGVTLDGSQVSNGTLSWTQVSGSQSVTPSADGSVTTNLTPDTYIFKGTYTAPNGCEATNVKRVIIKARPALSVDNETTYAGKTATLTINSPNAQHTYSFWNAAGTVEYANNVTSWTTPALENNTNYLAKAVYNGCTSSKTVTVTVNAPPSPTLTMADPHYCLGVDETNDIVVSNYDATYTYYLYDVSSPATKWLMPNGVYSKSTPTVGGETTFNYKAEAVYNSRTSSASNTISFTVHLVDDEVAAPSFTFSSCEDDGSVKVLPDGTPSGGVWSGTGVTYEGGQYRFRTNTAGVGTHTLSYTATASYGCEGIHTENVIVRPGNTIEIVVEPPPICENSGDINLNEDVTLDGNPVDNSTFTWTLLEGPEPVTPSPDGTISTSLTPGTYILEASFTNPNGCEATNVKRVIIKARPDLSVDNETISAGKTATLKINSPDAQHTYSFWNASGTEVYANNVTSWTTPVLENDADYLVRAEYDGCTSENIVTVTVNAPPSPLLTMADPHFCLGVDETNDIVVDNYDPLYTYYIYDEAYPDTKWEMPNGVYSKRTPTVGVETTFNYIAVAMYNSRTSAESSAISFTVHKVDDEVSAPAFTFSSCEGDGSIKLLPDGTPSGGVWSGTGVTYEGGQYRFRTNTAGVGTHTLTYTATASYGCEGIHTENVVVRPGNTIEIVVEPPPICENSGDINLNDDVTLDGNPVDNSTLTWVLSDGPELVTPSQDGSMSTALTPGTYLLEAAYTNPNGCEATNIKRVIIKERPELSVDNETIPIGKTATISINSPNIQYTYSFWNASGTEKYADNVTSWTTPVLENNIDYLVRAEYNECTTDLIVTVTVDVPPVPILVTGDPDLCRGADFTEISVANFDADYTYYIYEPSSEDAKQEMVGGTYRLNSPTVDGEGPTWTFNYVAIAKYNESSSTASDALTITMHDVSADITLPVSLPDVKCENSGALTLPEGDPVGGIWYGNGVTFNDVLGNYQFDPQGLSGNIGLTYEVEVAYGCTGTAGHVIQINDVPSFDAGINNVYCQNQGTFDLDESALLNNAQVNDGVIDWMFVTQPDPDTEITISPIGTVTTYLPLGLYRVVGEYTTPEGCYVSDWKEVDIIESETPALANSLHTYIKGTTADIGLLNAGEGTINWYSDEELTNLQHSGDSYTIVVNDNMDLYIQREEGSCTSEVAKISIVTSEPDGNRSADKFYDGEALLGSPLEPSLIAESKKYFNLSGNLLQSQSRSVEDGTITIAQPVLDKYERAAVTFMTPPKYGDSFELDLNYILNPSGTPFSAEDIESGSPVGHQEGSLGWYFSNNNTDEPYAPSTDFPYAKVSYMDDGTGEVKSAGGVGEAFQPGQGHETFARTFPILQELDADMGTGSNVEASYLNIRNMYVFPGDNSLSTLWRKGMKSVSVDVNGIETVSFTDESGNVLATAKSNRNVHDNTNYLAFTLTETLSKDIYFDFHIPNESVIGEMPGSVTVNLAGGSGNYNISDLRAINHKDVIVNSNSASQNLVASFYRIKGDSHSLSYSAKYYDWSYNFYDEQNRLVVSISPNGVKQLREGANYADIDKTTYEYNYKGWLLSMTEPDAGTTRYMYRKDGSVRFSQNEEQSISGAFSYTHYDQIGRPVESGEYFNGPRSFGDAVLISQLEDTYANYASRDWDREVNVRDWVYTHYDLPDHLDLRAKTGLPSLIQNYLHAAVSYTQNKSIKTWYSYDHLGRLDWMAQAPEAWDGSDLKRAFLIDYTYDFLDNVTDVVFKSYGPSDETEDALEEFHHHYEYDKNQRLVEVSAGKDPSNLSLQARYEYYLHGPLKREEFGGNKQGIDYVYNLQGWLKSINHPENLFDPGMDGQSGEHAGFEKDLFAMTLEYFNGDYIRAGRNIASVDAGEEFFNGNIRNITWRTGAINKGEEPVMYAYDYDDKYQLIGASFGTPDYANGLMASLGNQYRVNELKYDANGNILGLKRYDGLDFNGVANPLHEFTDAYNYKSYKNQLESINGYSNYEYNHIGQLVREAPVEGDTRKINYDVTGKVTSLTDDANSEKVSFIYNDRGFRLMKKNHETGLEMWYIRDASGNVLSTYEKQGASLVELKETMIYGNRRIGLYRHDFIKTEADNDYITGPEVRNAYEDKDYQLLPGGTMTLLEGFTFEAGAGESFSINTINGEELMGASQYELTDHLGNVRIGLMDESSTVTFDASMEADRDLIEKESFLNLESRYMDPIYNHTSVGAYSSKLNPMDPGHTYTVGPAINLEVSPGDTVRMEVYAQYSQGINDVNDVVSAMASAIAASFGGISPVGEGASLPSIFNEALLGGAGVPNTDRNGAPKAYLQYIVFNKNMTMAQHGHAMVTDVALSSWQKLELEVPIEENGYIYIYVANESKEYVDVYFDDMEVQLIDAPVTSASDYYPFGLVMNGRSYSSEQYRFGYQGQFAELDEETGWNSFELRMYAPVIGRWMIADPYEQYWNPYLGMGNDPVNGVDPDGGLFGKWRAKAYARRHGGIAYLDDLTGRWWAEGQITGGQVGVWAKDFGYQGLGISFQNAVDFSNGFANAVVSNHALGLGRQNLDNEAFEYGQFTGDIVSVGMGIFEMYSGGTMAVGGTVGGIVTSPTGVGAVAGGTIALSGVAIAVEGAATTGTALRNIRDNHGRVFAKKARSPHRIGARKRFNSRKGAYEAAKKAGNGNEPVLHPPEKGRQPHYHPGDGRGKPLNHDHYYFPKRFY